MVDDVLIDANGPLLTPLSPIPENDKVVLHNRGDVGSCCAR